MTSNGLFCSISTLSLNIPKCFPNSSRAFVLSKSLTFCVSPTFSLSSPYPSYSSKVSSDDIAPAVSLSISATFLNCPFFCI
nr:MAG TPA: hypothetical protein [Caudoviricetes sp.]